MAIPSTLHTDSFRVGARDVDLIDDTPKDSNSSEIIGTWRSGIWYWDVAASKWT